MSFLSRRLGFRSLYINVPEPMDSNNPHLHVIVFSISNIQIIGYNELSEYIEAHRNDNILLHYAKKKFKITDFNSIDREKLYKAVDDSKLKF